MDYKIVFSKNEIKKTNIQIDSTDGENEYILRITSSIPLNLIKYETIETKFTIDDLIVIDNPKSKYDKSIGKIISSNKNFTWHISFYEIKNGNHSDCWHVDEKDLIKVTPDFSDRGQFVQLNNTKRYGFILCYIPEVKKYIIDMGYKKVESYIDEFVEIDVKINNKENISVNDIIQIEWDDRLRHRLEYGIMRCLLEDSCFIDFGIDSKSYNIRFVNKVIRIKEI